MARQKSEADILKDRFDKIRDILAVSNEAKNKKLREYVTNVSAEPNELIIKPFTLFVDILEQIFRNRIDFPEKKWYETVKYAEGIYPHIFILEDQSADFKELSQIFLEMFDVGGVASTHMFIPKLYHMFRDKVNYLRWYRSIEGQNYSTDVRESISEYAVKIRPFCYDEDMFTASLTRFSTRYLSGEKPETIIDQEYSAFCRMVGIYNVSEERIMLAEQKVDAVQEATSRLRDSLSLTEKRAKMITELSANAMKDVKEYCDSELTNAKIQVDTLMERMDRTHAEFVEGQRRAILADKDEIVNRLVTDSRAEISELKKLVDDLVRNARDEVVRAGRQSDDVINRMDAYFKDNDRLKELLADAEASKKLNDRIDRLMIVSDKAIDRAAEQAEAVEEVEEEETKAPAKVIIKKTKPQQVVKAEMAAEESAKVPDALSETADLVIEDTSDEQVDFTPCFLLDETIPFYKRMEEALKRKEKMKREGMTFHKMFDDVLIAVMENANPYLIGPSGCGKTYMVQQIALILGIESIDIGYINEEYDILGFQTANGGYSRPNFYRCYKYGKIAFCDELDNGNSRATVKLNSFLSNTTNAHYAFPNGERVPRHPNFRIIGAGNTTGNGADVNYNTREKIEESVQQRFTPIFVGYDNNVEKSILGDYQGWFQFVELFRKATTKWSQFTHFSAAGIVTTRDVTRIRKYLDNRSFSREKIIEYEFVQTKEADYLAFLTKEIMAEVKQPKYNEDCRVICSLFAQRVNDITTGKDTVRLI